MDLQVSDHQGARKWLLVRIFRHDGAAGGVRLPLSCSPAPARGRGYGRLTLNPLWKRTMKIWIDADAAPRDVREVVFRASARLGVATVLVANRRVEVPAASRHVTAVRVEGGPDVADRYIEENAAAGDLAVTADIPLAASLVGSGVVVIDPRGEEFTADAIGERLAVRDLMDRLRGAGVETGGSAPYGPRDKQRFAGALDRVLTRLAGSG